MSILIKNMEMPTEGEYNMTLYVCSDGSAYMDVASLPVDNDKFEVVPVPPHGDLIERKEAHDSLLSGMVMTGYQSRALDCINEIYVPTIIPASEEGE